MNEWKGTKTKDRERIAVWLDNEDLTLLRKWQEYEALSIAGFVRLAIKDAIKRRTRAQARPRPPKARPNAAISPESEI